MKRKKPFTGKGKTISEGRDIIDVSKRQYKVRTDSIRKAKAQDVKDDFKKKRFYNDIYKS